MPWDDSTGSYHLPRGAGKGRAAELLSSVGSAESGGIDLVDRRSYRVGKDAEGVREGTWWPEDSGRPRTESFPIAAAGVQRTHARLGLAALVVLSPPIGEAAGAVAGPGG